MVVADVLGQIDLVQCDVAATLGVVELAIGIPLNQFFAKDKEVVNIVIDPNLETADVKTNNNYFPKRDVPTRFEQFKNEK